MKLALAKELQQEEPLLNHLSEKHVYPILRWKIEVVLERKPKSGPDYFVKYGEDFQNLTVEEYEYCRLLKKQHEAIGYDLGQDSDYQF